MSEQDTRKSPENRVYVKNSQNHPIDLPYDGGTLIFSSRQQKVIYKNLIDVETLPTGLVFIRG